MAVDERRDEHDYLEIRDLSVVFDGFVAVDGVDLTVTQGDLRFLIGPNGAGKTTIVDAITGLVPGHRARSASAARAARSKPHQIARAGVGRTFQTASVFEELTVLQNLDIAGGVHRKARSMLRARRGTPDVVEEALETVGLATSAIARPGCSRTGRSSGWRSACCSCRTRGCCCSTSPSPG